jgi:hypothetical protein
LREFARSAQAGFVTGQNLLLDVNGTWLTPGERGRGAIFSSLIDYRERGLV